MRRLSVFLFPVIANPSNVRVNQVYYAFSSDLRSQYHKLVLLTTSESLQEEVVPVENTVYLMTTSLQCSITNLSCAEQCSAYPMISTGDKNVALLAKCSSIEQSRNYNPGDSLT